jgi:hypothetical protein
MMGFKKTEFKAHNFALITNLVKGADQVAQEVMLGF